MKRGKWRKRCVWALGVVLAIVLIGFIAEKISRGSMMRPVRSIADKAGVTISPPSLTDEEKTEANVMAKEWRQACLEKYPILAVKAHPVPPEENGFLQLYLLEGSLNLSEDFKDLLRSITEGYDPEVAKRLLAEHEEAVSKVEHIASIPTQSSINMPDDYMGFIGLRGVKLASEILTLKACLAADEGDSEQALRYIHLTGSITQHMRGIETPFLLSETGVILIELNRQAVVLDHILPTLGSGTPLKPWHQELDHLDALTNQRFSELIRGEWQTASQHLVGPFMAQMDLSGEIADGKACAMAHALWAVDLITRFDEADPFELIPEMSPQEKFEHLSSEELEILLTLNIGMDAWSKGYFRSAVITARTLAAIELLMLETSGETLTAESIQKVTQNPLTQEPFLFDPGTRELNIADNEVCDGEDPIQLPW